MFAHVIQQMPLRSTPTANEAFHSFSIETGKTPAQWIVEEKAAWWTAFTTTSPSPCFFSTKDKRAGIKLVVFLLIIVLQNMFKWSLAGTKTLNTIKKERSTGCGWTHFYVTYNIPSLTSFPRRATRLDVCDTPSYKGQLLPFPFTAS